MSLMTPEALGKRIRAQDYDNVYYFYGHDIGALDAFTNKLINKLVPKNEQLMNMHKFDGKNLAVSDFVEACEALPFMTQRNLVVVNDLNIDKITKTQGDDIRKELADLPETTVVLIYADGVDLFKNKKYLTDKNKRFADYCAKHGTACEFSFKKPAELAKRIIELAKRAGCSITKYNAEYLANMCLCDTISVNMEMEKLTSYALNREITLDDINTLCIRHIESDGFALALNILKGNAGMVFQRLSELREQNYEPYEIIGVIGFSISDIYRAKLGRASGKMYNNVIDDFKYPRNREFAVRNAYDECSGISLERIRKTIQILSETDLKLKTKSMGNSDMLVVEQCVAKAMALKC